MAFANTNETAKARSEMSSFKAVLSLINECPTKRRIFNNTMSDIYAIAEHLLEGENLYREAILQQTQCSHSAGIQTKTTVCSSNQTIFQPAFEQLRKAVQLNDYGLMYDEPWGWMHPARHVLGALLLEQGHLAEAEKLYREDLGIDVLGENARCPHPNNIWSLRGLEECFELYDGSDGKQIHGPPPKDYDEIKEKIAAAESLCDDKTLILSSCACKQTWMSKQKKH